MPKVMPAQAALNRPRDPAERLRQGGVTRFCRFGSTARDAAWADGAVDLLLETDDLRSSLIEPVRAQRLASAIRGAKADVMTRGSVRGPLLLREFPLHLPKGKESLAMTPSRL